MGNQRLLNFAESGLFEALGNIVCANCQADSCDASDCPGICPGLTILSTLETQIGAEGIKFMKDQISNVGVKHARK